MYLVYIVIIPVVTISIRRPHMYVRMYVCMYVYMYVLYVCIKYTCRCANIIIYIHDIIFSPLYPLQLNRVRAALLSITRDISPVQERHLEVTFPANKEFLLLPF